MVAFSGGRDSTALLAALADRRDRALLLAAHLDHGLDPGSAERARRAARRAAALGVRVIVERREPSSPSSGGLEAAARRRRYRFLEQVRLREGARFVLTAHHRDDQAETVLLRLLQGSGSAGLAAIAPRWGAVLRPLLGVSRDQLAAWLNERGLPWLEDPGNRDLARARNLVRHRLLPRLAADDPTVAARLATLAEAARRAARVVGRAAASLADLRGEGADASLCVERLRRLPPELTPWALAALHRSAGRPYPPAGRVGRELARRLAGAGRLACDCGDGRRWIETGGRLRLVTAAARDPGPLRPFSYTLEVPGRVRLPEIGRALRLERRPVAGWMFRGEPGRAGLALPVGPGDRLQVRNRRPGDRIRPLGSRHRRRLKDVLIDRRVPRQERDRLPLLCVDGRIAWVPGVTIDEAFRLSPGGEAWVVEIESP